MKLLLFSGSLRTGSLNRKLLSAANQLLLAEPGIQTEVADLKTLEIPVYDGDIETVGIPEGVKTLGRAIQNADALVIASPEYNAGMAGSLKNAVDWVSRLKPVPLEKKPVLMLGASPGAFGSIRALNHVRAPFETLGAFLYPLTFALPKAHEAFSTNDLNDTATKERLKKLLEAYLDYAKRLSAQV